ncbi:T9SS type A sorting domain-containing protein [Pedobacter cryophilus]|uniref:T9SS type A sorting domain-containing protein n=1 Tax=Pedobacter cryophilus TaxID=2571271 RepID=A0A4U1BVN0_9SPHI|nr:T9SS type A sorting domain-containing protein [Pedobacter cryophilus]TKB96879.1 T9SS type A sorting domain-containing protein [Pedobacter cryophilus]
MRIKLLLSLFFLLSCKIASAQWANQVSTPWVYNFTSGTSATINTTSAAIDNSSTSGSPFLPAPPSGVSRVYAPITTGSVYTLDKAANTLVMVPSSTSGISKFSVYDVTGSSPIVTASITLNMGRVGATAPANNLAYNWILGNRGANGKASNLFNNASSGFNAAGADSSLFTSIRLIYSNTNDNYTAGYRSSGGSSNTHTTLNGGTLSPDVDYKLEAFINNSTVSKTYTKNATIYTVPAGTFHLWITNLTDVSPDPPLPAVRYSVGANFDLPKSVETAPGPPTANETMPADVSINSFLVQAASNTSNAGKITITGGMSLAYDLSTLPVTLTSFKGDEQNNVVNLNWRTASELNNDYFELLRAGDDRNFASIGKVYGNGTKNQNSDYYFKDKAPLAGNNYYKLKQVDFDGKTTIHDDIVFVKTLANAATLAVSSTKNADVNVNILANNNSKATLGFYNTNGQKVFETNVVLSKGFNQFNYNVGTLNSGVYVAKVFGDGLQLVTKFLKD